MAPDVDCKKKKIAMDRSHLQAIPNPCFAVVQLVTSCASGHVLSSFSSFSCWTF